MENKKILFRERFEDLTRKNLKEKKIPQLISSDSDDISSEFSIDSNNNKMGIRKTVIDDKTSEELRNDKNLRKEIIKKEKKIKNMKIKILIR